MFITRPIIQFNTLAAISFILLPTASFSDQSSLSAFSSDLTRVVSAIEDDEWFMDKKAYDESLDQLMPSVCKANDSLLDTLHSQLQIKSDTLGNSKKIFSLAGELNDEVNSALHVERKIKVLAQALQRKSECPFWVSEQEPYLPRQSGVGQLLLAAESGGLLQINTHNQLVKAGGGGAARLFGFYGISQRYSFLTGFGFGGGAFVNPETPEEDVDIRFFFSAPVILRIHHGAWHGDIESGLVTALSANDHTPVPGWRVGGMIGFSPLRVRKFLPWGGFTFSLEQYPNSLEHQGYFFKIGFRAGALLMD
jgi:hypothetical protein